MNADRRLVDLASRQHAVVTRAQALECGLTRAQVSQRVGDERLTRVHRATYRLAGSDPTSHRLRAMAAWLAVGPDAVVSHRTAAVLWEWLDSDGDRPHVTVPVQRAPLGRGIVVHRTRVLRPVDRTRIGVIPITTPLRTLLDLAADADDAALETALDTALLSKRVASARLISYLDDPQLRTFAGIGRLRALVADRSRGIPESKLERALDRLYRMYRLPPGVRQYRLQLPDRVVRFDRAYIDERVGVEVDGELTHAGRLDWQYDLERNNSTTIAGWLVLRFTWWHVHHVPHYVAVTIARALNLLPRGWRPAGTDPSTVAATMTTKGGAS